MWPAFHRKMCVKCSFHLHPIEALAVSIFLYIIIYHIALYNSTQIVLMNTDDQHDEKEDLSHKYLRIFKQKSILGVLNNYIKSHILILLSLNLINSSGLSLKVINQVYLGRVNLWFVINQGCSRRFYLFNSLWDN